jgi:hypothetical protein
MMLSPLRAVLWGWERIEEIIGPELGRRFENKLNRMVTPKLTVAGPTLESLRFAGDEPELREMYINLLETAMDKETAEKAHPAFAELIRQMTPDEAKIVRFFAVEKTSPQITLATKADSILLAYEYTQPALSLVHLDVKCDFPHLIPCYLDNLRRLEILSRISMDPSFPLQRDPRFERLTNHDLMMQQEAKLRAAGIEYLPYGGTFGLTSFGSQFCDACVRAQKS